MKLVIAEKPSVARDLARILGANRNRKTHFEGNGLRISWCFGHMCELVDPEKYKPEWKRWSLELLPMIPEHFSLQLRKDVQEHWKALKSLLVSKETTSIVNACDAGREGELIFRYVYQLSKCKYPVERLWVSSLTAQAIETAWSKLQPGSDFNRLADAARCRAEADWLVGLNATRAMTCMVRQAGGDQLLTVGRVQTPTLALIARRDHEIVHFVPQTFWRIDADFSTPNPDSESSLTWKGSWFKKFPPKATKEQKEACTRFLAKEDAQKLISAITGQKGSVTQAKNKNKDEPPPLLYDLNSLQQRANIRFGFRAQQTLDIAQALYERHKIITYPRTDARYLTPDQAKHTPATLAKLKVVPPYRDAIVKLEESPLRKGKRIYNASEVGDHHAIIPTGKSPMSCSLSLDEKRVFDLVARRFIAVFSPNARFHLRDIVVSVPPIEGADLPENIPTPYLFQSKGRVRVQVGWQNIDPPAKHSDTTLPDIKKGMPADIDKASLQEGKTRPPPSYTEASLLSAMERAGKDLDDGELRRAMRSSGLGTPATRANIIENLVRRKYIFRNKKNLKVTDRGKNLIEAIPIEELKSAEMTGSWEAKLSSMADGKGSREEFMNAISNNLGIIIKKIQEAPPPTPEVILSDSPSLGDCPLCNTPVRKRGKVFTCDSGQKCSMVIFESVAGRKLSNTMVKNLITKGETPKVKGFKSKRTKKTFEAALRLNEEGRVVFHFHNEPSKPAPQNKQPPKNPQPKPETPVGMSCPICNQGSLIQGRSAWGCNRYREGCSFVFLFAHAQTPQEAMLKINEQRKN